MLNAVSKDVVLLDSTTVVPPEFDPPPESKANEKLEEANPKVKPKQPLKAKKPTVAVPPEIVTPAESKQPSQPEAESEQQSLRNEMHK